MKLGKRLGVLAFAVLVAGLLVGTEAQAKDAAKKRLKIFILAGQSNMDGYGGMHVLTLQTADGDRKALFGHLKSGGKWVERDDVFIRYGKRHGKLTTGYGVSDKFIGVELEFGNIIGDAYDEPVLLIKTSWGGANIAINFRPPSSGSPDQWVKKEFEKAKARFEKTKNPKDKKTLEEVQAKYGTKYGEKYGVNYVRMLGEVDDTLKNLKAYVPGYADQGYDIEGFVWFQGFNDQFNDFHEEYETNLSNFIKDVRKEYKSPKLPFIIGQMGHGGTDAKKLEMKRKPASGGLKGVKDAQAAVCARAEFAGTVSLVKTEGHWDWKADAVFTKGWKKHLEEWKTVGAQRPYHYLGSPYFYFMSGKDFGTAMLKLTKSK
jgi:hypothetical protein